MFPILRRRRPSSARSTGSHRIRLFDRLEDRLLMANYDLSEHLYHDGIQQFPTTLQDHSGVAYSPAQDGLYVVTNTNGDPNIIEYDRTGTQLRRVIDLVNFDDTEGIF